jgi:hypothetical protein
MSFLAPMAPTISIRKYSARNRTTGACAKVLYKQRMTASTCLFSCCELPYRTSHDHLTRQVVRRQFAKAFLSITGWLPVK